MVGLFERKFDPSNVCGRVRSASRCVYFELLFVHAHNHASYFSPCMSGHMHMIGVDEERERERENKEKNKEREKVVHVGQILCGTLPGHTRTSFISSHICVGYEDLRATQTYESKVRGPIGWAVVGRHLGSI